jgi:hypothetical protein
MATKTRRKIGMMPCEGQRCESHDMERMVTVYESESGTLSYHCDICERSPYAKVGTGQHAEWMADMVPISRKPDKPDKPEAAAVAAPVVPSREDTTEAVNATNATKPKGNPFSLAGLMS